MLAIEIERRLREKRLVRNADKILSEPTNVSSVDTQKTLVNESIERTSHNYDTSAAVDSLMEDSSRTIRADGDGLDKSDASISIDCESSKNQSKESEKTVESFVPLSLNIETIANSMHLDGATFSPTFSLHSSPSLGALDDKSNQSLYFTPLSGRETLSPAKTCHEFQPGPLIRSNSYTIEKPSELLIKHMEENGIPLAQRGSPLHRSSLPIAAKSSNHINQSSIGSVVKRPKFGVSKDTKTKSQPTKTALLSTRKAASPVRSSSLSNSSRVSIKSTQSNKDFKPKSANASVSLRKDIQHVGTFRNSESVLRSVYDIGSASRTMTKTKSTTISNKPKSKISPETINSNSQNDYNYVLKMIEKQHAAQMNALIDRQKTEQKRMQEEFARQQDQLLKQISNMVLKQGEKSRTFIADETSPTTASSLDDKEPSIDLVDDTSAEISPNYDSNGNRINRFTPESAKCIRRLVYYDDNQLVTNQLQQTNHDILTQQYAQATPHEISAATSIAAFTRGYLTRRLFKTLKVQNVVKTIRDTLLFILDIHFEDNANESPADVKLKTHLIQQVP